MIRVIEHPALIMSNTNISSKTFIGLSHYAFPREDISYSKHVHSATCHGEIVQYSEIIVVRKHNYVTNMYSSLSMLDVAL